MRVVALVGVFLVTLTIGVTLLTLVRFPLPGITASLIGGFVTWRVAGRIRVD